MTVELSQSKCITCDQAHLPEPKVKGQRSDSQWLAVCPALQWHRWFSGGSLRCCESWRAARSRWPGRRCSTSRSRRTSGSWTHRASYCLVYWKKLCCWRWEKALRQISDIYVSVGQRLRNSTLKRWHVSGWPPEFCCCTQPHVCRSVPEQGTDSLPARHTTESIYNPTGCWGTWTCCSALSFCSLRTKTTWVFIVKTTKTFNLVWPNHRIVFCLRWKYNVSASSKLYINDFHCRGGRTNSWEVKLVPCERHFRTMFRLSSQLSLTSASVPDVGPFHQTQP